jgi:hypothetical protein
VRRPRSPRFTRPRPSRPGGGRGPGGDRRTIALVTMGIGLYLAILWLGVVVIGDNPIRSALMAGLIVCIAAAGYVFTRRPGPPGR